jgi:hypothetical protein
MAQTHGHPIPDDAIVAKNRVAADHNAAEVVDAKTPSYLRFAGKIDPGENLSEGLEDSVKSGERPTQPRLAKTVAPSAKTIHRQGPEALAEDVAPVRSPVFP